MADVRAQGRPVRGISEVGRVRIIDGTRRFLQTSNNSDWSRKNIAEFIGVTPALITYYFPERADLFVAVTVPVINDYIIALERLEACEFTVEGRLRELIALFVECNTVNYNVFASFKTIVLRSPVYAGSDLAEQFLEKARSLFAGNFFSGDNVFFSPQFIVNALWGICKFNAETNLIDPTEVSRAAADKNLKRQLDQIYTLVTSNVHFHAMDPNSSRELAPSNDCAKRPPLANGRGDMQGLASVAPA